MIAVKSVCENKLQLTEHENSETEKTKKKKRNGTKNVCQSIFVNEITLAWIA